MDECHQSLQGIGAPRGPGIGSPNDPSGDIDAETRAPEWHMVVEWQSIGRVEGANVDYGCKIQRYEGSTGIDPHPVRV